MSQLDRIEDLLQSHIKDSSEKHTLIMRELSTLQANEKTNYRKLQEHDQDIEGFKATQNKGKGALWILGIIWLGCTVGIPLLISWFKSH